MSILTWCCTLVFLCLLALFACENTSIVPKAGDHEPQEKDKQLKDVYDIMAKSSGKGHRKIHGEMHVVHHLKISQKAKGTYGGAADINRPKSSRNAATSFLGKPPTLFFSAVIRHIIIGWFIFALV
ncbi:uncharacterized protein LOC126802744 isoform X2 [Argentina anserina]|uniref:uncharacterized protein LOC126802744 isoform X2 n=1 Tax=Argentina anserina TaxID=57926 RepID=UPI0021762ACD|nr:uncharacterized protein LOC126802744 isoform X2 [Potentilla anserina]